LLLFTSAAFGQIGGDPNGVMPQSSGTPAAAAAAAAKPFASFTGVGSGVYDFVDGPCAGVTCSGSDSCECLSITGATLKASAVGASTFAAKINVDVTTLTHNGADGGFCDLATGPATITAANGDTVSLDLTTQFCVGFGFVKFEDAGGWTVVGGTGKLATAAGTGVITLTGAEGTIPASGVPVAVSMNGVFHK
jgi:hypothetical protein